MFHLLRTNSSDPGFCALIPHLDAALRANDGEEYDSFFIHHNKTDNIRHVVVAYENETPVGCGAIKEFEPGVMEVKRMFVPEAKRGNGIASAILKELETWAAELGYTKCILETGNRQTEAVALYRKRGYDSIPKYGPYVDVETSVCFEKRLVR